MKRSPIPADIEPGCLTAIIDTREQIPLDLAPLQTVRGTLRTGDYSLQNLEHVICLERKSLPDLLGCMTSGRERFEAELMRMRGHDVRVVLVECDWSDLLAGDWRSNLTAASAIGSVLGWVALGIPFLFVGTHEQAGKVAARLMFIAARRRWREARALVANVMEHETATAGGDA